LLSALGAPLHPCVMLAVLSNTCQSGRCCQPLGESCAGAECCTPSSCVHGRC